MGNYGIIAVDNSGNPSTNTGAVYKGLAIATDSTDSTVCSGKTLLYATNFRAGSVEIYEAAVIYSPLCGSLTRMWRVVPLQAS